MDTRLLTDQDKIISISQASNPFYAQFVEKIKSINFGHYFSEAFTYSRRVGQRTLPSLRSLFGGFKNSSNKKFLFLVGFIIVAVIALGSLLVFGKKSSGNSVLGADSRPAPSEAKAEFNINRIFMFPIKDEKGKEVSKFSYEITKAELFDSIIVKGQRASAVKGRTFLIINLKIKNDNKQPVQINTKDYIRISVNNSSELNAPDIHNDPVEVQAISTKFTRVGVAINDSDKNIILHVGEIDGKKENIRVNF